VNGTPFPRHGRVPGAEACMKGSPTMKQGFKVTHFTRVPAVPFGDEAPGVSIRLLIDDEADGAPNYVLRMIEVEAGRGTPDHVHRFEHENYIVEGRGRVMIEGDWHELSPGDVVFVPPGARHTYRNTGDATFRFLCGIPASRLREPAEGTGEDHSTAESG
jgi:quercetin dioxygenase-like cupin family protein